MDKDFRPNPDADDLERHRLAALAAHEIDQANAVPQNPVQFFGKPEYPTTTVIQYTEDGRPISPRYDEAPVEPPKDSSVLESVTTSQSASPTAPVAGLEDLPSGPNPETTAPVEKASGQPPVAPVSPPSLPSTPTPPGRPTPTA